MQLIFSAFLLLATVLPNVAMADSLEQQRQRFVEAKTALEAGDVDRFKALKGKLKQYPLTPYLELWEIASHLDQGNDYRIQKLLVRHAKIPEAVDMQIAYVKNLADRGQWPHVAIALDKLPSADRQLPEISMMALWYTGKKEAALDRFAERWQRGYVTSDLTFKLERKWRAQNHPTRSELWKRIGALAKRGTWQEIRQLEQGLPEKDRAWVSRWNRMQKNPLKVFQAWKPGERHIAAATMVGDGLQRLSRNDAVAAWKVLHRFASLFDERSLNILERRIALRAATEQQLAAADWLQALPRSMQNEKTRSWIIRLHLAHGNWQQAFDAIAALPGEERANTRWDYWQARALEALGKRDQALLYYGEAAKGRGYYSFLSAERAGLPYVMAATTLDAGSSSARALAREKGIKRAHEWWLLGDAARSSREWNAALQGASRNRWRVAAGLATQWHMHDRVIQAAYQAGEMNALVNRFPTAFKDEVATTAEESGLPLSLIWSIIRQESAFNAHAVSRAGAKGLMQLMPATAGQMASDLDMTSEKPDLFDPAMNIRLGSLYLGKMAEQFNANYAIAAAAYNAGPHRVSKWLERRAFDEPDIWIETIPYAETRRYVQQVMAFTVVYDWRQSKPPVGIGLQIKPVQSVANSEG